MTKRLVAAAATVALCFVFGAPKAEARGVHIQAGGLHVDVGNPHGFGYGHGYAHAVGYGNPYRSFYGGGLGHGVGYGGYGGGYGYGVGYGGAGCGSGRTWHDTSHYDWHGPSLRRHGNHFDYTPGHYDFHRDGHWDHH